MKIRQIAASRVALSKQKSRHYYMLRDQMITTLLRWYRSVIKKSLKLIFEFSLPLFEMRKKNSGLVFVVHLRENCEKP